MNTSLPPNSLEHLAAGLNDLVGRFGREEGALDGAAARETIEALRSEAEALGVSKLYEPLGRLALLSEVWECLAGEAPESAAGVAEFCQRALAALASSLGENDCDLGWITRESFDQWGAYIDLLSGGTGTCSYPANDDLPFEEPVVFDQPSPPEDDCPSRLDLGSLIRLLTTAPAEPHGEASVDSPMAVAPREPLCAGLAHDFEVPPSDEQPLTEMTGDDERKRGQPHEEPRDHSPSALAGLEPELREAFLADAADLFERIQTLVLVDLESGEHTAEVLRELGRSFHTLKGAAGSVGLSDLADRVHDLEDQLELAASGAALVPLDRLHEALAHLESVLKCCPQSAGKSIASRPPERPEAALTTAAPSTPASASDGSVRISCERLEEMMDVVSELITRRALWAAQTEAIQKFATEAQVTRSRLSASIDRLRALVPAREGGALGEDSGLVHRLTEQADDLAALADTARAAADPLADDADALARLSLRLWDTLQAVRVQPVRGLFHRLARVAREAARVEGRQIEVVFIGEDLGLDRSVQERAFEPLLHAVRNAVGHGIEPAEGRIAAGKPAAGRVTLEARREGYTLLLSVHDDGRGLDYEAIAAQGRRLGLLEPGVRPSLQRLNALVFQNGFSTRAEANAVAGRGVGMDVVSQEVSKLHGTVSLSSERGAGTTLAIRLPARLALEQAMVVRVEGRPYALPLASIELADQLSPEACAGPTIEVRDRSVPLVDGRRVLGSGAAPAARAKLLLVRAEDRSAAFVVDSIDGPRELVLKPLGPLLAGHPIVAGTSLSSDGELVIVLDPFALVQGRFGALVNRTSEPAPASPARRALVVDDALSVRRAARRHLRAFGLETDEAADGLEALRKLRSGGYRLILTDLDMPRMDGFELLAELRRSGVSAATPVVVISTRSDPRRRSRVCELGARAFVPKPIGPDALAQTIAPLLEPEPAGTLSCA